MANQDEHITGELAQRKAKLPKSLLSPTPHSADAERLLRDAPGVKAPAPLDVRREITAWMRTGNGRAPMEGALQCNQDEYRLALDLTIHTVDARLAGKQLSRTSELRGCVLRLLCNDVKHGSLARALASCVEKEACRIQADPPDEDEEYSALRWLRLSGLPEQTLHIHLHRADLAPKLVGKGIPHEVWAGKFFYPADIDFSLPAFNHLLARGVAPRKYRLTGVLAGRVGADGAPHFQELRAWVRSVEGEGGPWYDLDDPNTELSEAHAHCLFPNDGFRPLRLYYSAVSNRPRRAEGDAAAAGDEGVSTSEIQQHYAPCGRPLNQVAREERVRERLRTRLGKRSVPAATKVPKEAEPSPDEDSDSDDGAVLESIRERLGLDPITASDFEKPVDPKTAGAVKQLFATCEAMPQVVRDKCDRAQELMDAGDKDAALRLMREVMAMPETDAAMVEGAKAVAEAANQAARKEKEEHVHRPARATWPIFTNAHIEQAMKEEVECSDRPYSAPNFVVTTDEYTRTSAVGGTIAGATAEFANGSMREETHRVTRTTIDVDPAAEGGFEAAIRAWRYTIASTGDRGVLFGREMVNNPDTLAVRVMPWAQNYSDVPTIGKHNQKELAIAMESRPGLVEFKYPQTFEMRSHNKSPKQERSNKYRLAGVLFTACPARPNQPVRSVLSCPFVPQKAAVDGKENPGVEQFSRARETWLFSDENVLDESTPPFIVGVLKNAAPMVACKGLIQTGLNLAGVVRIADTNPNELSLAEGLLATQLQALLAINVPSGLWDSVRQCVLEVAPAPLPWISSLLRTFSTRLRAGEDVDERLVADVLKGETAQVPEIWACFRESALGSKSLRNKHKASFAEVAVHYSESHHPPVGFVPKPGDMVEAARAAKKGAAMAFGDRCLRDAGIGEDADARYQGLLREACLVDSPAPAGWLGRITNAGLSDEQFDLMETMCQHLQELLALECPGEHLSADATQGDIRELYESHPRIRQLMDVLMSLKATNIGVEVWGETVALTLMGRPTPPVWLQRVLSGFRKQMATTNESEQRKADRQPPRLHVTRHEAYFASSMGSDRVFGKKQWVEATDSLSPSEGARRIVNAPPPACVGTEDGEERAAVLYYRLEDNQAREERFISEMIRPHYSSFADGQRCHLLEKMASVPVLREELFHVASKTMRSMDAALILAKVAAALCAIQEEETQDLLLDKLSEPEVTPRIVNIVLDAIVAQPKRRSGKAKAKAEAKAEAKAPTPPKPTKREQEREAARLARQLQEACEAELAQQKAAGEAARVAKLAAEQERREELKKKEAAKALEEAAKAIEAEEAAKQAAEEGEQVRVQKLRESRADAHQEHSKAQQQKRDPNATGLQRQLAADAKAAEEAEKEASRVAKLAAQQSRAQAAQDAAYANSHEAQMAARAAQAVANKARKKANKERERAGAAEQAATATVAAQAEAATTAGGVGARWRLRAEEAARAAAATAELDALWTGPDAAPTAPAPWASAARADIAEAVAVAQEEEDLQKAMALSRLDSPPPAASARACADDARGEEEQARARAEASVNEARARIAREWAARRTATTPADAGRGGRGGGRGRGRGRGRGSVAAAPVAAAPPAATQADEESLCVVCLVDAPTILCAPCGHQCLCAGCAVAVDPVAKGCPYCRAPVVQVIRVLRP